MNFRPMTQVDLPWFLSIRNECRDSLHDNRYFTIDEAVWWFSSLPENQEYWVIELTEVHDPKLSTPHPHKFAVGYFRITKNFHNYTGTLTSITIGADLHKEYRGYGIAYDAYKQFMDELRAKNNNLHYFVLEVLGNNATAYNLYRKLGFEAFGVGEILRDGRYIPSINMERCYFND